MDNETICIVESEPSDVKILNIGILKGTGIAMAIGMIAFIGFVARGLFIYYLKYEAPKDRPINRLMFHDQVRLHSSLNCFIFKEYLVLRAIQNITCSSFR